MSLGLSYGCVLAFCGCFFGCLANIVGMLLDVLDFLDRVTILNSQKSVLGYLEMVQVVVKFNSCVAQMGAA